MSWFKKIIGKNDEQPVETAVENPVPVAAPAVEPIVPLETEAEHKSWLARLTNGLSESSQKLTGGLVDFVTKRPLDQAMLDDLEEALIQADLGPGVAAQLVSEFARTRFGKDVSIDDVKEALAEQITALLDNVAKPLEMPSDVHPFVMLMVGVNGSGKTTTIGKLATHYAVHGKKVIVAAGDTFRAAAVEQLTIWSHRSGAQIVEKGLNADPAAVAFAALEQAEKEKTDIVMIDTAGRLQNQNNLMEELAKIHRVIQKKIPEAPHATILTLDATIGQNALKQVEIFNSIVPLSGLVITKLDGSARAGIIVALARQFSIPIIAIGVGEKAEDLQPFHAADFAKALVG